MHFRQGVMVIGNSEAFLHTDPYLVSKIGNTFKTYVHCSKFVTYLALTTNEPLQQNMEMDHKHM
jgi:hypothetical protein